MKSALYLVSIVLLTQLFSVLLIPSFTETTYACSCVQAPNIEEDFKKNRGVVFRGKVIESTSTPVSSNKLGDPSYELLKYTIKVDEVWKGVLPETINYSVNSLLIGGGCGVKFDLDKEYILFGSIDENGEFRTNTCSVKVQVKPEIPLSEDTLQGIKYLESLDSYPPNGVAMNEGEKPNTEGKPFEKETPYTEKSSEKKEGIVNYIAIIVSTLSLIISLVALVTAIVMSKKAKKNK